MITQFDEYAFPQLVTTNDHVADSDPRWFERYWFNVHDLDGRFVLGHGIGVYPNTNVMDGFAVLLREGAQRAINGTRALDHDRMRTVVGPISVTVLEGLRTIRLQLDAEDVGIAYDLVLEALTPPVHRAPLPEVRVAGVLEERSATFVQAGRASGWLAVDGERLEANPERCWFTKTNAWGVRSRAGSRVFVAAQFPGSFVCLLDRDGEIAYAHDDGRTTMRIVDAVHDVRLHPETGRPTGITSELVVEDGRKLTMSAEVDASFHLPGMYGAYDDFYSGLLPPDEHLAGEGHVETRRVDAATEIEGRAGRDDHTCRFELEGQRGYGVIEVGAPGEEPYVRR